MIYGYASEALELLPVNNQNAFNQGGGQGNGGSHHSNPFPEPEGTSVYERLTLEIEAMKADQKKAFKALDKEVEMWKDRTENREGMLPPLVQTIHTKTIHANTNTVSCSPPSSWCTLCGWHYHWSSFVFLTGGYEKVSCQKCLVLIPTRNLAQSSEVEIGEA